MMSNMERHTTWAFVLLMLIYLIVYFQEIFPNLFK